MPTEPALPTDVAEWGKRLVAFAYEEERDPIELLHIVTSALLADRARIREAVEGMKQRGIECAWEASEGEGYCRALVAVLALLGESHEG